MPKRERIPQLPPAPHLDPGRLGAGHQVAEGVPHADDDVVGAGVLLQDGDAGAEAKVGLHQPLAALVMGGDDAARADTDRGEIIRAQLIQRRVVFNM